MIEKKYRTSLNCANCIRRVTPLVSEVEGIASWEVDTMVAEKTLTLRADDETAAAAFVEAVEDAGFDIEEVATDA